MGRLGNVFMAFLLASGLACRSGERDRHGADNRPVEKRTERPVVKPIEVPDQDWRPLWDRVSLHNWKATGSGKWVIRDSVLIGTHRADDKQFGHLISDSVYTDFLLRARFRLVRGNSGLYFRSVIDKEKGISGLQVEMSDEFGTGGLWETNGRGWVVMPLKPQVATWFKPNDWNDLLLQAKGKDIAVWMNGIQSATFRDDDPRFAGWQKGHFAIQLHAGKDVRIEFASIDIAPL